MQRSNDSFWKGVQSVLCLVPDRPEPLLFVFRGYDIQGITASEALRADWNTFGLDFKCSLKEITDGNQPSTCALSLSTQLAR